MMPTGLFHSTVINYRRALYPTLTSYETSL